MAIQGLRDTTNFVTDQRPKNWREAIMLLYPNGKAPLTAMTSLMKSRKVDDPEFNWWDKALPDQRVTLTADIDATQTAIGVASGALAFKAGHLIMAEQTGEIMLISSDPASDTSITVVRGYSDTTATLVNYDGAGVNPKLRIVGNAYEEGSLAPTGINYDPVKRYNYTQIFRNTLEMTRTAEATRLRTGDQVKEAKRECLELHSIEIEKALWFGKKKETVRNGKPIRTTDGIIRFIDSGNIIANAGANVTMAILEGWLERIFRYGSSEKMGFCGNMFLLGINQAVRKNSHVQIQSGIKEFGMNVSRLTSPWGEVVFKTHPLFNQLTGGTTSASRYYGVNASCFILDAAELYYPYIKDTAYEKDLAQEGMDGMKSGYLTECGVEVHHPLAHFYITGVETGAVDA